MIANNLTDGEQIRKWWIMCETTDGKKFDCTSEFDLPDSVMQTIDGFFEEDFPCEWQE